MSLDGNGTYSPPAPQFPAIPNTVIYADDFNQIILDIATALSTAIFRDGQAAFTADQSIGGNKLTNLKNGTLPQDATTVLQVFTDPVFLATTVQGFKVTGSMLQALMSTVNLVASGTLTLTGTTLLDGSASGEVRLPANSSIGNVSATELAYLDGVTGNLQTQLNGKVDEVSGTAADLALTGIPTAPTAPLGTNTNQVATMAALIAQAFSATLPEQMGNAGKFVTTDGTIASWASAVTGPGTVVTDQLALFNGTSGNSLKALASGTLGQVLLSNGSGASPTWGSIVVGSLVLLSTVSVANTSTVDITGIDSTYDEYLLLISDIVYSANAQLRCQFRLGATYQTGASYFYRRTLSGGMTTDATSIMLHDTAGDPAIDVRYMTIKIPTPANAKGKFIDYDVEFSDQSTTVSRALGIGAFAGNTDALTGLRFFPHTGTITSGNFRLYGLKKS